MRVLLVEDEPQLRSLLKEALEPEGYDVDVAGNGDDAVRLAIANPYDAVVLDVRLPGRSGFSVLEAVRAQRSDVPVIFLTACAELEERVRGLDLGADDYLVKPVEIPELHARLRAHLRRRGSAERPPRLRWGELELDLIERRVRCRGREIELTNRELDVLRYLLENPNRPVSRAELMRAVWKEERPPELLTNVIEVCINGLRKKLEGEGAGCGRAISTVRGVGYMVRPPDATA